MSMIKDVCDRARSLWLRVVRSTHPANDVDGLNRLIDGKNRTHSACETHAGYGEGLPTQEKASMPRGQMHQL